MKFITSSIESVKQPIVWFNILSWILYILVGLGVYFIKPSYVHWATIIVHTLICLFLIIKFNPFVKVKFDTSDTAIIFSSAVILLLNVVFSEIGINRQQLESSISHMIP